MRRILLMLPVLALAACQSDTPTAIDTSIQLEKTLSDTKLSFLGVLVLGYDWEEWQFLVPSETRSPTHLQFYVKNRQAWNEVTPAVVVPWVTGDWTGDSIPDMVLLLRWPRVPFGGPCSVPPFFDADADAAKVMMELWYGEDHYPPADYEGTVRVQVDCPIT